MVETLTVGVFAVPNVGTDWSMDSHMNAIWLADVLGRLIEQKVDMVDQVALAGQYGIVGGFALNPIYYDYLMYQQFGTELVRSASDDPLVNIYASKRSDSTLAVMIVNLSATTQTKQMTILGWGARPRKSGPSTRLTRPRRLGRRRSVMAASRWLGMIT